MKQTLKSILGITTIAIFFFILSSALNYAQGAGLVFSNTPDPTEPPYETPQYPLNKLVEQNVPLSCGETSYILDTSANRMLESQILIGEIRTGGQPFGEVIGILSFGHSVERNSGTFFMTVPGIGANAESMTCILGYGVNWRFFDDDGNLHTGEDSL
mgnify:CR=1 FL=1